MLLEVRDSPIAPTLDNTWGFKVPKLKAPNGRSLKLRHFAAFVTACRCTTFIEAARELAISQPSLSRNIQELEQAVGKGLFQRSNTGIELSSAGHQLLPHAVELLSAHQLAMDLISSRHSSRMKLFRAVASPWMVPLMAVSLLSALKAEFDAPNATIQSAACDDVERQVANGEASLGVCASRTVQPELRCTPVLEAPMGLLVATGSALPSHIDTLDMLSNIPLVRLCDQAPSTKLLQQWGQPFSAYFQAPVCLPCITSGFGLVQHAGMGMITSGVEASHPQAVGMHFIPLPHLLPLAQVRVVSRRGNVIDTTQERMRELLCESLRDVDWHPSVARLTSSGSRLRERSTGA